MDECILLGKKDTRHVVDIYCSFGFYQESFSIPKQAFLITHYSPHNHYLLLLTMVCWKCQSNLKGSAYMET